MSWVIYSFIALIAGCFYGLSKKWALNLKISKERLLLATFFGSFIFFFIYNFSSLDSLLLKDNLSLLIIWGLIVALLSMFGNYLDTCAMKVCPNPAYAEGLKSSEAILVAVGSTLLFNAPLSFIKILGMILISAGIWPLLIHQRKDGHGNWKLPSLLALFVFAAMILLVKWISLQGFEAKEILLILFFYGTIGYLIINIFHNPVEKPEKMIYLALILALIFAFISNLAQFTAIELTPNAGYSQAISNSAIVLTLILSKIFFGKNEGGDFNLFRWTGVAVVVAGVILVAI